MKKIRYTKNQIQSVVQDFWQDVKNIQIITLTGGLGSGKTTFVAALLKNLGSQELVTSPTFTYLNVYNLADGKIVYHFDLYRLKSVQEFQMAGFFEYFNQPNSLVIIEWPEMLFPALLGSICKVELEVCGKEERIIKYSSVN